MFKKQSAAYSKCPTEIKAITTKDTVNAEGAVKNAEAENAVAETAVADGRVAMLPNGVAPISKIFIDDLTERRRTWRVPWFILILSCVQLLIYFIGNDCIYQRLMYLPSRQTEYWRYLTYMLLHSDLLHLLLNVCLQCLIACLLECEQGHWKVAAIYAAGGVSGSLVTVAFQPQLALLGASAGVYALLLSHIPHLLKNFSQLPHRYLRVAALLILCLGDVGFTSYHFLLNHNTNPRICLEAHIAGGSSGLCLGFLLYKRLPRKRDEHGPCGALC